MVSCRFSNTHRPIIIQTFIYKRKYIQTCMRTYCIVEYTMQSCACILSLGPQPVGFQSPFTSSLGEFHAFGTGSGILGYCPCWCPSPFPFAFHVSVFFHPLFLACHWISFVFLLYDRCICIHSVDPSLSHVLDEFPGLELALGPDVVVPEAEQMRARRRNLVSNFCSGRGLKLHAHVGSCSLIAANVITRLLLSVRTPCPRTYL